MDNSEKPVQANTLEDIHLLLEAASFDAATALCEKMCAEPVVDARVWQILGALYGQNNDDVRAESCTRQALAIDPGLVSAYRNLVILLQRHDRLAEAEQHIQQALKLQRADATLHFELGNIYKNTGKLYKAVDCYREAIRLAPRYRDAHFNLGSTFLELKDLHSALGCMRASFACDHNFVKAKAMEANLLEMQGDIEGAWKCLEPWLDRATVEPVFADAFASVSKYLGKELQAIDLLEKAVSDRQTPAGELPGLYCRMGNLQEKMQQYDKAFRSYTLANQLSDVPDNAGQFIRSMHDARRILTQEVMAAPGRQGKDGAALVFIVGMPRSGTSLVEQILSAHSRLVAGGELAYLSQLAQELLPLLDTQAAPGNPDYPAMQGPVRRYVNSMKTLLGTALRVTDKTPHNFKHLGLIKLLFPDAHIIHCRRSPLDTCVSCYSKNFTGKELAYSNSLESLGEVYSEYRQLMDYWTRELSIPVLDVPYEAVVADTEYWARRIVEYCGLAWEPQCLEFYKVKRQVHTASYHQVRQRVYRSSVQRWVHFDSHMAPLKSVLGDAESSYQQYLQENIQRNAVSKHDG